MRLVGLTLVGSLWVVASCGSDEDNQKANKPVELSAEQKTELQQLEAQVRKLESDRVALFENLPTTREIANIQRDLEDRQSRLSALTQRGKVVPCLVAELARIVSEGTSIDIVEISADGIVIELPVADGSKFEPAFNACGAVGASKKIDGGWAFEAKLLPVEAPRREPPKQVDKAQGPPPISILGQLPRIPIERLKALRTTVQTITKQNSELVEKKQRMDALIEQMDQLTDAERALKAPPDIPGTIEAVKAFAKAAKVDIGSLRPERGNNLVRLHVELRARLLDMDSLLVKLQARASILVVEKLVLKPGDGNSRVPIRMTLASPRL